MEPPKKDNQAQHWASIVASLAALISAASGALVAYYNIKRPTTNPPAVIRIETSPTSVNKPLPTFTPVLNPTTEPIASPTATPTLKSVEPIPSFTPTFKPSESPQATPEPSITQIPSPNSPSPSPVN